MKKFLFNEMFDEEIIERQRAEEAARISAERIAEENAPPTYTVEELEDAKTIAHQQGMQEGKAEAMASIEQQASLTLELVLRKIDDLLQEYKNWTEEVQHDSITMSTTIMRKLAPELLRGSELPQVEHIINEAFQFLTDQPKVMIRVASDLEPSLGAKVNLLASRVGYEGQVVLTGDPELELTDCRISWHAGAVERALDETWNQIDEMVDRVLRGLPAREHPEPEPEIEDDPDLDEDIPGEDAISGPVSDTELPPENFTDAETPSETLNSDSEIEEVAISEADTALVQTIPDPPVTEGDALEIAEEQAPLPPRIEPERALAPEE